MTTDKMLPPHQPPHRYGVAGRPWDPPLRKAKPPDLLPRACRPVATGQNRRGPSRSAAAGLERKHPVTTKWVKHSADTSLPRPRKTPRGETHGHLQADDDDDEDDDDDDVIMVVMKMMMMMMPATMIMMMMLV